jgi:hypothetical protein
MRLLISRILVGLFAFLAGLVAVALWSEKLCAVDRTTPAVAPSYQPALSALTTPADDSNPLDACWIENDVVLIDGFEIAATRNKKTWLSSAYIRKNGKVLASWGSRDGRFEFKRVGLFPFLGPDEKQLIVEGYSGGAHCCWSYWIYELTPNLRLIYESNNYEVGYELWPIDLDQDGTFEFTQSVMAFDYFLSLPHSDSPFPTAVFMFEPRKKAYLPANRRYSDYVLEGLDADLDRASESTQETGFLGRTQRFSTVLRILLKYVYGGRENEGWKYYDEKYTAEDKERMRSSIKNALRSDPIYRTIY